MTEAYPVRVAGVSKSFGKQKVLTAIDLAAEAGETLCLLGPSGAGKTTLLRLLTGALKADEGTIAIAGERVPGMAALRKIGYMPQDDAVYQEISGLDNLLFFGGMFRIKGEALRKRANALLELVDLGGDRDKLVAHYSGGMKKRLSLAIALLHDPEILILDEPTVGIDPVLRKEIWGRFSELAAAGKTLLIATHVMDEAEKCEKAALLYNGRLLCHDRVERLLARTGGGHLEDLFFAAGKGGDAIWDH